MANNNSDLIYWLAWLSHPKIGPTRFALLRRHFSTLAEAWQADSQKLLQAGLDSETVAALSNHRHQIDPAKLWARLNELKISVVALFDEAYPKLLKEIADPPPLLFYKGSAAAWQNQCLAIVGSRRPTGYGLRVTSELGKDLAVAGLTIVSGLAYGIDTAAHQAALEIKTPTIAVLASGLDIIYPAANRNLADKIMADGGALLSEFTPGRPPLKQNFPYRNRIIAGLARGTLVTEATLDSGALITAKLALEYNRDVFAVPGSIFSDPSQGTNELLKLGARLVTKSSDILDYFGLDQTSHRPRISLNDAQEKFLEIFTREPKNLNDLIVESTLPVASFMAQLTEFELAGWVKETSPNFYARAY